MNKKNSLIEYLLRFAVASIFISHGIIAYFGKEQWVEYLSFITQNEKEAYLIMKIIGVLDISLGLTVVFYPIPIVLLWCAFWGFLTAAMRPICGESFLEFFERAGNWITPLVLYLEIKRLKK